MDGTLCMHMHNRAGYSMSAWGTLMPKIILSDARHSPVCRACVPQVLEERSGQRSRWRCRTRFHAGQAFILIFNLMRYAHAPPPPLRTAPHICTDHVDCSSAVAVAQWAHFVDELFLRLRALRTLPLFNPKLGRKRRLRHPRAARCISHRRRLARCSCGAWWRVMACRGFP